MEKHHCLRARSERGVHCRVYKWVSKAVGRKNRERRWSLRLQKRVLSKDERLISEDEGCLELRQGLETNTGFSNKEGLGVSNWEWFCKQAVQVGFKPESHAPFKFPLSCHWALISLLCYRLENWGIKDI